MHSTLRGRYYYYLSFKMEKLRPPEDEQLIKNHTTNTRVTRKSRIYM